jgi:hypothetical protein
MIAIAVVLREGWILWNLQIRQSEKMVNEEAMSEDELRKTTCF